MVYLYFFIILLISSIFRLLCLDKVSGLWYDELVLYNQANLSGCIEIVKHVLSQDLNFPLYQIILHYWISIFGNSDFCLRFLSVIFGVLTCITAYFVSSDKRTNLLCMSLFAVNSFLIYYSQDVKVYSLSVFFATLNLVSLIKIYEKNKGYILWLISSVCLIFTYTTAFWYVILEIIIFSYHKFSKKFIYACGFLVIFLIPIIFLIFQNFSRYTRNPNWFYTDTSSFFLIFQNFFTPKLIALDANPVNYIGLLLNNLNIFTVILVFCPILIALYFMIKALIKDDISKIIFLTALMYLLSYFFAFKILDINILSRYLIILLPNFLIVMARGIDYKKVSVILFSLFIILNFIYLCFGKDCAYKINRSGYKNVAQIINKYADNDDIVIFRNDTEIMDKYLTKKIKKVSLLQDFTFKSEFFIENENNLNKLSSINKKLYIKSYLCDRSVPQNITIMYGLMYVLMKKNKKLFLVIENQFDKYDKNSFVKLINNENMYKMLSYNKLLTIKTLLDIQKLSSKNLIFVKKFVVGDFVVYEYQKN